MGKEQGEETHLLQVGPRVCCVQGGRLQGRADWARSAPAG